MFKSTVPNSLNTIHQQGDSFDGNRMHLDRIYAEARGSLLCVMGSMGISAMVMQEETQKASTLGIGIQLALAGGAGLEAYRQSRKKYKAIDQSEAIVRDDFRAGKVDVIRVADGLSLYVQSNNYNPDRVPVDDRQVLAYTQAYMQQYGIKSALFDVPVDSREIPEAVSLKKWFDDKKGVQHGFHITRIDETPILELTAEQLAVRIDELRGEMDDNSINFYMTILRDSSSRIPRAYEELTSGSRSVESFRSVLRQELEAQLMPTGRAWVIDPTDGVRQPKRAEVGAYIQGTNVVSVRHIANEKTMETQPLLYHYGVNSRELLEKQLIQEEDPKKRHHLARAGLWLELEALHQSVEDRNTVEPDGEFTKETLFQEIETWKRSDDRFRRSRLIGAVGMVGSIVGLGVVSFAGLNHGRTLSDTWHTQYKETAPMVDYDEYVTEHYDTASRSFAAAYDTYKRYMLTGMPTREIQLSPDRLSGDVADAKYDTLLDVANLLVFNGMDVKGYWTKSVNDRLTLRDGTAAWNYDPNESGYQRVERDNRSGDHDPTRQMIVVQQKIQGENGDFIPIPVRQGTVVTKAELVYKDEGVTVSTEMPIYFSNTNTWAYQRLLSYSDDDYIEYTLEPKSILRQPQAIFLPMIDQTAISVMPELTQTDHTAVEDLLRQKTYSKQPLQEIKHDIQGLNGVNDLDEYVAALRKGESSNCASANTLALLAQKGMADQVPMNIVTGYLVKDSADRTLKDGHAWTVDAYGEIKDYTGVLQPEKPKHIPFDKNFLLAGAVGLSGLALVRRKKLSELVTSNRQQIQALRRHINEASDKRTYTAMSFDYFAQKAGNKAIASVFAPFPTRNSEIKLTRDEILRNVPDDFTSVDKIIRRGTISGTAYTILERQGLRRMIRAKRHLQKTT